MTSGKYKGVEQMESAVKNGGSGGDFEGICDSTFKCKRFEFIAVKVTDIQFGDGRDADTVWARGRQLGLCWGSPCAPRQQFMMRCA